MLPETLACLNDIVESVRNYTGEIIIVDNNSTDNTAEVAKRYNARVLFEEHQQIAKARNSGTNLSSGRYLIFIDADTLITRTLFNQTVQTLESFFDVTGFNEEYYFAEEIYLSIALNRWGEK